MGITNTVSLRHYRVMRDLTAKEQAILYGSGLARLRRRTSFSQAAAADLIDVTQQTWQKYEAGTNQAFLDVALQRRCVEALGFSMDDLEREVEAVSEGKPIFDTPSHSRVPDIERADGRSMVFPLDGEVKASPNGVSVYQGDGTETFDVSGILGRNTRFLRIYGESVYPYAEPGGYVSYNPNGAPKRDGGVIVRFNDGQFFVKKYVRTTNLHVECLGYEAVDIDGATAYKEVPVKYALSDVMAVYPVGVRV